MSDAAFKAAGNKALAEKNYEEAIEAYTKAIEINAKDHTYFSNRSLAHLYNGSLDDAVEDADACITLNPSWAKGYLRKGQALTKCGDFEGATAALQSGLKLDPNDASLASAMQDVERAKNSPPPGGGGGMGGLFGPQMLAKLAGHPKFGPKLADPVFKMKMQMMQSNPQSMLSDPEMMEVLQAILSAGGMGGMGGDEDSPSSPSFPSAAPKKAPEPTLSPEQKAAADTKSSALAAKERGNALYKEKKFDEAIAAYDEAYSIEPNPIFLSNKAAVFVEMNRVDEAIEICNHALATGKANRMSYEDTAKILQRIASAHIKAGRLQEGMDFYAKAQLEAYDKAIERKIKLLELDFKKAQKAAYINPELALAAKEAGNAAFRDGKFPEAISQYEEAIKRDPSSAPYRNNLAAAYLKMGLFNDAKREVEKSLELDRTYVKAWAKKGDIETYMKEYHKALDSYRAGLQLDPNSTLCKQGIQTVTMKINVSSSEEDMKERQQHAMADPEIQRILQDPSVRQCLTDMQENPAYAQKAMTDPLLRSKIEKLVASGVVQVK